MGISLETYALLKAYVDEHGGGGDKVSPLTLAAANEYTDEKDAATLAEAKAYAESVAGSTYIVTDGTPGSITIGTGWSATEPFQITVTAQDYTITEHTMVSILPKAEIMMQMRDDGVQMLYITNNEGTLTAYAVGNPPKTALTVPVLYTEVE